MTIEREGGRFDMIASFSSTLCLVVLLFVVCFQSMVHFVATFVWLR